MKINESMAEYLPCDVSKKGGGREKKWRGHSRQRRAEGPTRNLMSIDMLSRIVFRPLGSAYFRM